MTVNHRKYIHDHFPTKEELLAAKLVSRATGEEDKFYARERELFPDGRSPVDHFDFLWIRGRLAHERGDAEVADTATKEREYWLECMTPDQQRTRRLVGTDSL